MNCHPDTPGLRTALNAKRTFRIQECGLGASESVRQVKKGTADAAVARIAKVPPPVPSTEETASRGQGRPSSTYPSRRHVAFRQEARSSCRRLGFFELKRNAIPGPHDIW